MVWEYKSISAWVSETDLNILGADGWELVSFTPPPYSQFEFASHKDGSGRGELSLRNDHKPVYIFKRPRAPKA